MIEASGVVSVDGINVGHFSGLRFLPDNTALQTLNEAQLLTLDKALQDECVRRLTRISEAEDAHFIISVDGKVRWQGEVIAALAAGEDFFSPSVLLLNDDRWGGALIGQVMQRLMGWVAKSVQTHLANFLTLKGDDTLSGHAKELGQLLCENAGIVKRRAFAKQIKQMDQDSRVPLRQHHIRFGTAHVYLLHSLKPAPRLWLAVLYTLKAKVGEHTVDNIEQLLFALGAGRTSFKLPHDISEELCHLCGFAKFANYAVRVDSLEKLFEFIRQALVLGADGQKPKGYVDGKSFYITPDMLSFLGIDTESLGQILLELGYVFEERPKADILPVEEVKVEQVAIEGAVEELQAIKVWTYERKVSAQSFKTKARNFEGKVHKPKGSQRVQQRSGKFEREAKPRVEKKMDPNSPFAVLANLKSKM